MPRRIPRILLCAVAAAAAVLAVAPGPRVHAATVPLPGDPPAARDLDAAGWQYAPDPRDRGRARHWAGGRARHVPWRPVTLPHVFRAKPVASAFGGTVGWYRLRLRAPQTPGFTWAVRFEQVRRVTQVYLDGHRIAAHADPYAPFTVALPRLGDGRRHVLVLRVDNRKGREPREGWWNWGGITRPAQLVPLGGLEARDTGFLPQRTCDPGGTACRWTVLVDTTIVNRGRRVTSARLEAALQDDLGRPAGAATALSRPLAPGEQARVRFRIPVTGPIRLWGPGHPALYPATLRVRVPGGVRVQQLDRARIGLRTVTVRDGLLELNGQPVELRGASIQEDVKGHGPALTDADVTTIVSDLQALGANATRAHYALDERLQQRLDEAGILVWAQAPIYHRDRLLESSAQRNAALRTVRAAVLATRNHPATITHSVANELSVVPDTVPGTATFLARARALTTDLDPTLPVSVDTLSYPGYPRQEAYATFPLIGMNTYFGWYPGKRNHPTGDVAELLPYLQAMRTKYPASALVVTEYGAESTMIGPATEKETYAFQDRYIRQTLAAVHAAPAVSGALYWTLQEFAVKPRWDGGAQRTGVVRDSIHNKGLITYDGRRKPAFDALRDAIRATPLVRAPAAVAAAQGTRLPAGERGRRGIALTVAVLAAIALVLAVDVWVALSWRLATRPGDEGRQPPAATGDEDRPRLRLIA